MGFSARVSGAASSDRFDYEALGHVGSVEVPGWGQMEQEGEIRGHKIHIMHSLQLAHSLTCSFPSPFSHMPETEGHNI